METTIISYILPKGLLEHFTVTTVYELCNINVKEHYFEISLEENNRILNEEIDISQYESKGFTEITIQDFPIRGKALFLKIKRRRWRNKINPSLSFVMIFLL